MKENIARYIHRKHLIKTKKPTFDSLKTQSLKQLAKIIKIIRGQLIQKTVRKISETKESKNESKKDATSSSSSSTLENKLKCVKEIDHQNAAKFLFCQHVSSNYNDSDFPIESMVLSQEDEHLINDSFKGHSKVVPIFTQFDEKMQVIIDELEIIESQKNPSKSDRSSLSSLTVGKAVFMESLNSENADILDESSVEGDEEDQNKEKRKTSEGGSMRRKESKKRLNDKLTSLLHPARPIRSSSKRKAAELSPYGPRPGDELLMYNGSTTDLPDTATYLVKSNGKDKSYQQHSSKRNDRYPKKFASTNQSVQSKHSHSNTGGDRKAEGKRPANVKTFATSTIPKLGDTQLPDKLHPSWAAKRSKEQTGMMNIQVTKSSSNKIIFDD